MVQRVQDFLVPSPTNDKDNKREARSRTKRVAG